MDNKQYFNNVADKWDEMRQDLFSEKVREKAYNVADINEGETAADIGAGTGFITEGLLKYGLNVIAVDHSKEMLKTLQSKYSGDKLECLYGEAENLPVQDKRVDYVFANMFLHHIDKPPLAINEMARILKLGGSLVITDLDKHDFNFLRSEQNDTWLGFERNTIRKWFKEAGLENIKVDCVDANCCSRAECKDSYASISIFYAYGEKSAARI